MTDDQLSQHEDGRDRPRPVRENRIDLDAPITRYLPASLTRAMHVYRDTDYSGRITVSQLIGQTSGLADFETGRPRGLGQIGDTDALAALIALASDARRPPQAAPPRRRHSGNRDQEAIPPLSGQLRLPECEDTARFNFTTCAGCGAHRSHGGSPCSSRIHESRGIVDSIWSLVTLDYPQLEVIVINAGSTDDTLQSLVSHFGLRPVARPAPPCPPCRPVRAVLPRAASPGLLVLGLVLDNGGKADSLNAGTNFASYPLFCSIDADSILGQDALAKTALPFIEDPELVTPAPPHLPGPRAALRSPGRPAAHESGQRSHRFRSSDCWRHRPCAPG